jgi:hypothetical protein
MNASKLNKILALTKSANQNESVAACRMLCRALNELNYSFVDFDDSTETESTAARERPDPPKERFKEIREIRNKYRTYCQLCRESIPAGTRVFWAPGEGVVHIHCLNRFY